MNISVLINLTDVEKMMLDMYIKHMTEYCKAHGYSNVWNYEDAIDTLFKVKLKERYSEFLKDMEALNE